MRKCTLMETTRRKFDLSRLTYMIPTLMNKELTDVTIITDGVQDEINKNWRIAILEEKIKYIKESGSNRRHEDIDIQNIIDYYIRNKRFDDVDRLIKLTEREIGEHNLFNAIHNQDNELIKVLVEKYGVRISSFQLKELRICGCSRCIDLADYLSKYIDEC